MIYKNKETIILIIILIIGCYLLFGNNLEGYDSATLRSNESRGHLDDYYLWRAYGHNPYDHARLQRYPYNYSPISHPKRYTHYNPYFYQYGYGHL